MFSRAARPVHTDKALFWKGISGTHFGYAYDSVLCLNKMAHVLGHDDDAQHWNATIGMSNVNQWLSSQWEIGTPSMFGDTSTGVTWSNVAPSGISFFPRNWTMTMAERWLDNAVDGFAGVVPLTCAAKAGLALSDRLWLPTMVFDCPWLPLIAIGPV